MMAAPQCRFKASAPLRRTARLKPGVMQVSTSRSPTSRRCATPSPSSAARRRSTAPESCWRACQGVTWRDPVDGNPRLHNLQGRKPKERCATWAESVRKRCSELSHVRKVERLTFGRIGRICPEPADSGRGRSGSGSARSAITRAGAQGSQSGGAGSNAVPWGGTSPAGPLGSLCARAQLVPERVDTATAGGTLIFHIFGALARFERELIRKRTSAGLKAAEARGRKGGRRPVVTPDKLARVLATSPRG